MENREKIIELIEKQIEIEKKNVRQVQETEKKVGYAAAKLSLLEIRLDSQKHADILKGMLDTLRETPTSKTLWEQRLESYVDPFVVQRELNEHVKREAKMIKHVEQEIKQTRDETLRSLLQHIADDERKHHKILANVVRHLQKSESKKDTQQ